ncbi:hypothetical protein AS189_06960 [Arthrobacter alpinus]|uniref:Uncharacterized protein n=1 Tax=Arthrobacter alpinus TaxID=656366 RepID=A0A0S2LXU7_9MICC|nr:hypothetical protein [Arthrobacter alpinus]ALO66274.1 hypothetical protein AS189_06960 [Arthrobacter alpinus]
MDATSGAEGQWIADALEQYLTKERWEQWIGTVAATIPDSYEAYARIFHRMNQGDESERRWADIAQAKRTQVHPEAQFHLLAKAELYQDAIIDGADGVEYWRPDLGALDAGQLTALAAVLGAHSGSSSIGEDQDIFQAVWDGWGGFDPGSGSIPAVSGEPLTVAGGLRKYWVFRGSIAELARPPWFDDGLGLNTQSPNLVWPADRSWCLATEIDFDSTLVGGTAELIAAVVHSSDLEALEVTPATNLSSEGDKLNGPVR